MEVFRRFHKPVGDRLALAARKVAYGEQDLVHFAIAGSDKRFKWGRAIIEHNTVVVWHEDIPDPTYLRYAWADHPDFANLYNKEGLPASPFRTDE